MIAVYEQFSDIDVSKLGITKCLEILKLPLSSKEAVKEELSKEEPDLDSIDNTIQANKELQEELANLVCVRDYLRKSTPRPLNGHGQKRKANGTFDSESGSVRHSIVHVYPRVLF